jgi:drug/metabolite transporter (DMT)-like permease
MRNFRQVAAPRARHAGGMNTFLYLLTVLIWGTTWIAITFQLGVVPAPVSIAYRFWIAAACCWPACCSRAANGGRRARPGLICSRRDRAVLPEFPVLLLRQPVGHQRPEAVVFSTAPLWNAINGRIFLGRPIKPQVMAGALLGLAGIVLLFAPQMAGHWHDSHTCSASR